MNVPLKVNGLSISSPKMQNAFKGVGDFVSKQVTTHGYGSMSNSDLGYVLTKMDSGIKDYKAIRDAVALSGAVEGNAKAFLESAIKTGAFTQVTGSALTGTYSDMKSAHDAVFGGTGAMSTHDAVKTILSPMDNPSAYDAYVTRFENEIASNFTQELSKLQGNVRSMGFNGDVTNLKDLNNFLTSQSGNNAAVVQKLIDATSGKLNKVDEYILGRIKTGEINVADVLRTGQFNGVPISNNAREAFKMLAIQANTDSVTTTFHNEILAKIGHKSTYGALDLTNPKHVEARIKEFGTALSKAGYHTINGSPLSKLSLKELNNIDLSKIKDTNVRRALEQYVRLKNHHAVIEKASRAKGKLRDRIVSMTRKVLKDSDLADGIGQLQSLKHKAQFAQKTWRKFGKPVMKRISNSRLGRFARGKVKTAYTKSLNFIKNNLSKLRSATTKATRAVSKQAAKLAPKTAAKLTARNAKRAAKKATKKVARKATSKAARKSALKLAKKARRKITNKIMNKLSQKGAQLLAKAGIKVGAQSAATGAAAGGIGTAMVAIIWIIAIIVVIGIIAYLIGGLLMAIMNAVMSVDDSFIGDIARFVSGLVDKIKEIKWPWLDNPVTEEDRENMFNANLFNLIEAEKATRDINAYMDKLDNPTYKGGLYPPKSADQPNDMDVDFGEIIYETDKNQIDTSQVYYDFRQVTLDSNKNEVTVAANESSYVKLCMSMAHAFTYPVEKESGMETFAIYLEGLWNHLIDVKLVVKLEFDTDLCDASGSKCGNFTYHCNTNRDYGGLDDESLFYSTIVEDKKYHIVSDDEKANGKVIDTNTAHKFYIVDGEVVKRNDSDDPSKDGCERYRGNVYQQKLETIDVRTKSVIASSDAPPMRMSEASDSIFSNYSTFKKDFNNEKGFMRDISIYSNHYSASGMQYRSDPHFLTNCIAEKCWASLNTSAIDYCSAATVAANECVNSGIQVWSYYESVYKQHRGTFEYYSYYEDGTITCMSVPDAYIGEGNCSVNIIDNSGNDAGSCSGYVDSFYCCKGHTDKGWHGYMSTGYAAPDCDNYEEITVYHCPGHNTYEQKQASATVCYGHIQCHDVKYPNETRHPARCNGHTVTYCQGHIKYFLTRTATDKDYSDHVYADWEYTKKGKVLFWTVEETYTCEVRAEGYKKSDTDANGNTHLAREAWVGWSNSNKEIAGVMMSADWAMKYNVHYYSLVGNTLAPSERTQFCETYNITQEQLGEELWNNVNAAFDAIGKIACYPEDKAVTGGYADANKFGKLADEVVRNDKGYNLSIHGLDQKYFADWIWMTTHENQSLPALSTGLTSCNKKLNINTAKAGTPIVFRDGGQILTGIYIGYNSVSETFYYVGLDSEMGWCTILQSTTSNWFVCI